MATAYGSAHHSEIHRRQKSEDAMYIVYTKEQLHHTLEARCLVSVSERHSLFSFSLLSLTVESVIHAHGLSDRRYLLLFELKHNNKQ